MRFSLRLTKAATLDFFTANVSLFADIGSSRKIKIFLFFVPTVRKTTAGIRMDRQSEFVTRHSKRGNSMSFLSWLGKRMSGWPQIRRTPARKPASRFRPQLETLEGRDVPSTLTVSTNLDSGAGSLRADIAAAHAGDTINFGPNVVGQINLTSQLYISTSLTIQGPGAGQLTIHGGGYSRVFEIAANINVTLSGLTISGGGGWADPSSFDRALWDGTGGGILNFGTLTLTAGCIVTGNSGYEGGGIANFGTLTIDGSAITGNTAKMGGGIYNAKHASLTVTGGSTVLNNTATAGDIYNLGQEHISKDSMVGINK